MISSGVYHHAISPLILKVILTTLSHYRVSLLFTFLADWLAIAC